MKHLKKVLIPFVALLLAFTMIFASACSEVEPDKKTYTVTYIANGAELEKQYYEEGELLQLPEKTPPVITGYEFYGWNTDESGNGEAHVVGTPVTSNKTYYAVYHDEGYIPPVVDDPTAKKWTVSFDSNGGTEVADQIVVDGGTPNLFTPFYAGHTFLGWYTDPGCTQKFEAGTAVHDNITLYAKWEVSATGGDIGTPSAETVLVTFMLDGSTVYTTQEVEIGKTATKPTDPQIAGKQFTGWYKNGIAFSFTTAIVEPLTLTAQFAVLDSKILELGAYNESLYVIWSEGASSQAKVEYKAEGAGTWTEVDAPLIRQTSSNEARVDILGLAAGKYNVQITTNGSTISIPEPIEVEAYDRSGYAHFNYTDGVGAYNDDGTLKDNALVIYVTNENKDYVMDEVCAENADVDMFKIPYYDGSDKADGGTNWDKNASGIGWWLNNNQYTASNAGSSSNKNPSNTYDPTNGGKLGFKSVDRPIVIRFIGTVETPEGCTAFDSVFEGGGVGDNGHMARMKNLKNVTLEGVGDDAMILGWGFHFIAGTDAKDGQGTSFEVRNLTFYQYPEDAVGMEGQQSGSTITAAVERCWIHNNTFLPGYCANPAESDKKEGDGSCDFKRGQYFTASYNWFEYCHKTNLIGSSDSSLQYNMTYHHNVWWQCGSRIPLTRQANVHFYNNYVMVDQTETSTPYSWVSKPSPSYVHSLRANCYLFSEANYYDGAKNITDGKNGGAAKSWNNMIYANSGTNTMETVVSREQAISNSCKYGSIDYTKFDTDPTLFYYDTVNKVSDCLLDDAVTARQKDLMYAGANGHGITETAMNKYTPTAPVVVGENGTTISLPTSKGDSEVSNVLFRGITGASSGTIKYKGQGITFTLAAEAQLTVETSTTGDPAPELIGASGRVYAHKFTGTLTIVLQAGTYIIATGQKDKEAVITSLKFEDTSSSSQARVDAAVDAINALVGAGEAQLTDSYEALLNTARSAYNALTATEKAEFDSNLYNKLQKAIYDYGQLQMQEFERLVAAIGTVNENSYNAINAAQQAYDKLTSDLQAQVTGAKATLDAAWKAYEAFAVTNVENLITAFVAKVNNVNESTARATIEELLDESEAIIIAYNALSDDNEDEPGQKSQVTNYNDLVAAIEKLENINKLFVFQDTLDYFDGITVSMNDAGKVNSLKAAYEALSDTQKALVTSEEKALYEKVLADFNKLQEEIITSTFLNGQPSSSLFTHTGSKSSKKDASFYVAAAGQTLATGLKFESGTELTLTVSGSAKILKLYFNTTKSPQDIKIDGTVYTCAAEGDDAYVVTVTLQPGDHTIARGSAEIWLYYATLSPAA